jgi:mono/diheme cytochrome c family protein
MTMGIPTPEHCDSATPQNLEADVERLHRAILREPRDPEEGQELVPWWLWAVGVVALFWGGWYLGRTGGPLNLTTHVAYATPEAAGADAGAAAATTVMDPVERGKQIFTQNCQACHQATGLGIPDVFPPLVGSEWVTGPEGTMVRILLDGLQGPVQVKGGTFNGAMPAWRNVLPDADIAAVATYIRQWAPNAAPAVDLATVAAIRASTVSRGKPWTAPELQAAGQSGGPQPAGQP